jgi:predicted transglutaminase-like protease
MSKALLEKLKNNKMAAGLVAIAIISTLFSFGVYHLTKDGLPFLKPENTVIVTPTKINLPPPAPKPLSIQTKKMAIPKKKPIEETHTWDEIRLQLDELETTQAELMRHILKHDKGQSALNKTRLNIQVANTNHNLNTQSLNEALAQQQKKTTPFKIARPHTNWSQVQQALADLFIQQEHAVNAILITLTNK